MSLMLFTHYLFGYVGKETFDLLEKKIERVFLIRYRNLFDRPPARPVFDLHFHSSSNGLSLLIDFVLDKLSTCSAVRFRRT